MTTRVWIDGCPSASLDWEDRGLHYGDGLFETIALRAGEPLLWKAHLERLRASCRRLALPMPDEDRLLADLAGLAWQEPRGVLKIILTRGSSGRGYRPPESPSLRRLVSVSSWPEYPTQFSREGIVIRLCETRLAQNPALAGLKHLGRLEQVLAQAEWDGAGIAEGLMQDGEGWVIEGTMSNLFLLRGGCLLSPDLSQCGVAGVMRQRVLEAARMLGIPTSLGAVSLDLLLEADEVFMTNSLIGIWPVRRLEDHGFSVGTVTRRLQQACSGDIV